MTHGSLFSGIGGIDLGFERAGIETVWQIEMNAYCKRILRKNFPEAELFTDVTKAGRHNLKQVDVISGGFPCQDISIAGRQAGLAGKKSGLWFEMLRIIDELRPRFAVIENVANLVRLGLARVVSDLTRIGYDCEWQIISANDAGAPHLRRRMFIISYPSGFRFTRPQNVNGADGIRLWEKPISIVRPDCCKLHHSVGRQLRLRNANAQGIPKSDHWRSEPRLARVANGIPNQMDRIHALGNAVVPQVAQYIGELLMQFEDR